MAAQRSAVPATLPVSAETEARPEGLRGQGTGGGEGYICQDTGHPLSSQQSGLSPAFALLSPLPFPALTPASSFLPWTLPFLSQAASFHTPQNPPPFSYRNRAVPESALSCGALLSCWDPQPQALPCRNLQKQPPGGVSCRVPALPCGHLRRPDRPDGLPALWELRFLSPRWVSPTSAPTGPPLLSPGTKP